MNGEREGEYRYEMEHEEAASKAMTQIANGEYLVVGVPQSGSHFEDRWVTRLEAGVSLYKQGDDSEVDTVKTIDRDRGVDSGYDYRVCRAMLIILD